MLTWRRRLNMALDAAKGMLYLHSRKPPIIHRDLKSPNLVRGCGWVGRLPGRRAGDGRAAWMRAAGQVYTADQLTHTSHRRCLLSCDFLTGTCQPCNHAACL